MATPAPVAAPVQAPWRVGLIEASVPIPLVGERVNAATDFAIEYRPDTAGSALATGSFDPCDDSAPVVAETDSVAWNAWGIVVAEKCTSLSTDEETERARALRRLVNQTGRLLEYSFWTGDVNATDFGTLTWPNRPLADTASVELNPTPGTAVGIVTGFGLIYDYLADTLGSLRDAVIHVPSLLLSYLAFYGIVERSSETVLRTTLADYRVAAGTGYPGTGPDGAAAPAGTTWIYATSPTRTLTLPSTVNSVPDHRNNEIAAYAHRLVLAEWDLQAHAAVQVCTPDPGPAC